MEQRQVTDDDVALASLLRLLLSQHQPADWFSSWLDHFVTFFAKKKDS